MNNINSLIIKGNDYYSAKLVRYASVFIVLKIKNFKISPEAIVFTGLLTGIISAYLYSLGTYPAISLGSLLFALAWFLDFVDGDLARITNRISERGEWLDSISGRILEMVIYFGVCFGLSRSHSSSVWLLGFVVVALQHIFISMMSKEAIMCLKLKNKDYGLSKEFKYIDITDKRKEIGIIKTILREFTIGTDINGYVIILGGLINKLMPALIICLIYNIIYLLFRLTSKGRYYFK